MIIKPIPLLLSKSATITTILSSRLPLYQTLIHKLLLIYNYKVFRILTNQVLPSLPLELKSYLLPFE